MMQHWINGACRRARCGHAASSRSISLPLCPHCTGCSHLLISTPFHSPRSSMPCPDITAPLLSWHEGNLVTLNDLLVMKSRPSSSCARTHGNHGSVSQDRLQTVKIEQPALIVATPAAKVGSEASLLADLQTPWPDWALKTTRYLDDAPSFCNELDPLTVVQSYQRTQWIRPGVGVHPPNDKFICQYVPSTRRPKACGR